MFFEKKGWPNIYLKQHNRGKLQNPEHWTTEYQEAMKSMRLNFAIQSANYHEI